MSEYLELPDLEGTTVSKGEPLPEGHVRPNRTTRPLSPEKELPPKSAAQKAVEVENEEVIAARQDKERKKQDKGPVAKKRTTAEPAGGRRKKKKLQTDEMVVSGEDETVDADPLNQAHPEGGNNAGGQPAQGAGGGPTQEAGGREVINLESTHLERTVNQEDRGAAGGTGPLIAENPNPDPTHSPGITSFLH